ncbi:hypothetical protein DL93DRAFT_2091744 [Clavulina sp. PMI_390]|nr:hypothetical protein DL93DRAFT_2091744 [Clavulina sp. PMI_390]
MKAAQRPENKMLMQSVQHLNHSANWFGASCTRLIASIASQHFTEIPVILIISHHIQGLQTQSSTPSFLIMGCYDAIVFMVG